MRSWTVDQFEFDDSQSEESLEVSYAKRSAFPFPDVVAFVASVVGSEAARNLPSATPFDERRGNGEIRKYLERFTGLSLPSPCDWPMHVLTDDWSNFHVILSGPDCYISYLWFTSA